MDPRLTPLLLDQSGTVARRQALAAGLAPHDLARLLRRRELAVLHPGVYLDHTGEPSWVQRAWGGVLACWPAALAGSSALRAVEGPGARRTESRVTVVVDHRRTVRGPSGVDVVRCRRLHERVQWNTGPPRVRYEEAVLDVASSARSPLDAVAELAAAVQERRTTADRLAQRLAGRSRCPSRAFLSSVLDDVAQGTCSALEHGYLTRVERPHGLRGARRQVRERLGPGLVYRDVVYDAGLVLELDGGLFHASVRQRDDDLDRDLVTAARLVPTVRLSYGQVFERPCVTALHVSRVLAAMGSRHPVRPCGDTCAVGAAAA